MINSNELIAFDVTDEKTLTFETSDDVLEGAAGAATAAKILAHGLQRIKFVAALTSHYLDKLLALKSGRPRHWANSTIRAHKRAFNVCRQQHRLV